MALKFLSNACDSYGAANAIFDIAGVKVVNGNIEDSIVDFYVIDFKKIFNNGFVYAHSLMKLISAKGECHGYFKSNQ